VTPADVPTPDAIRPEWADALAAEIRRVDGNHDLGAGALADALVPFVGDIVEAARRDALREAAAAIRAEAGREIDLLAPRWPGDTFWDGVTAGKHRAANLVTDLRDADTPRRPLSATGSDQDAVSRIPGSAEPQIAAEGCPCGRTDEHGPHDD
jgi:hypothetical protein